MKLFTVICLAVAMVIGGSTAAYSCDGGHGGGVGCKVTASPLTTEDLVRWVRVIGLIVP
jgi:hypothetical protein